MSTFGGSSVGRTIVGGAQRNNVGGRMRDQDASASPPVLQLAVVIEYVYQPQAILSNAEIKDKWMSVVNNPELIDVMPVGSVIAQIISDSGGLSATGYTILFPFFSSHIQFPVKIGEIIHVVYQDYVGRGNQLGFWMTRVHGNRAVEDANYTHLDRQFDGLNNLQNWSTNQLTKIQSSPEPGFPNGAGTIDTHTVRPIDNQGDPYAHFLSASQAAPFQSTMEPVPRWNKRPGEFVLQGSNNTMVVFGEDRTGPVDPNVNTEDQEETAGGFSGTIDIVAGRGRHLPASESENPTLTSPRVIKNSKGLLETDKAPWRNADTDGSRKTDNPNEGDPDFINDAARLMATMQAAVDEKFGITELPFPDKLLPILQPTSDTKLNRSYVVGKADHVRMIARTDAENGIDGTLLFLRQGAEDDGSDIGLIWMDKNGLGMNAKKVFFGQAVHEDPNENDNIDYNDDSGPFEPWILWSKYKDTVDSLQGQINALESKHKESIQSLRNGMKNILSAVENAFSANACPPYGQNPAITAAKAAIAATKDQLLDTPVDNPLTTVADDLSDKQKNNDDGNVSKKNHSQKLYGE